MGVFRFPDGVHVFVLVLINSTEWSRTPPCPSLNAYKSDIEETILLGILIYVYKCMFWLVVTCGFPDLFELVRSHEINDHMGLTGYKPLNQ